MKPFFWHWGVVLSGIMLIRVALIWLNPDTRIESRMRQAPPAGE
ncbi:hypothetical protein [Deinococcus xinjiangensis]